MADQVLYSGVACITDLMVKEGLINLDFADVRAIMREMGKAMMGTGEASGDKRAILAAEAAIANPLLDEVSMKGARGLLISITGGNDLTLYEVDEAASRIRQEVDEDANIILGATFDSNLDGIVRVSVVATGIDQPVGSKDIAINEARIAEVAQKLRAQTAARQADVSARMAAAPVETPAAPLYEAPVAQSFAPSPAPVHYAPPAPPVPADVEIMPVAAPKASSFVTPVPAPARPEYQDGPFIPPAPVHTQRSQRMPQIEDLPMPVQNQIRAQRTDAAPAEPQGDTKRRTLLERLASFSMGRRTSMRRPRRFPPPRRGRNPPLRCRSSITRPRPIRRAPPSRPPPRQNMANVRLRRVRHGRPRISTGGRCRRRATSRTTSSRSRRSCAANRTERDVQNRYRMQRPRNPGPLHPAVRTCEKPLRGFARP